MQSRILRSDAPDGLAVSGIGLHSRLDLAPDNHEDDAMLAQDRARSRRIPRILITASLLALASLGSARSNAGEVVQLINGSGQVAANVLNSGSPFVTSFQGTNDVTITLLSGTMDSSYVDVYPPASAHDNNPAYISSFVGSTANGTGNGSPGGFDLLQETAGASLQFDFSTPLTSSDHFLLADLDTTEKYSMTAYTLSGSVYTAVSLTGWTLNNYTGQMGELPNSQWATWDPTGGGPTTGTFTSNANGADLNEPLQVLTPDRSISRIVFTEISGEGTPGLQFYAVSVPEPSSLLTLALGLSGASLACLARRRKKRPGPRGLAGR
jgi:PEP-CTERM motif